MFVKNHKGLTTTQIISLGFLGAILVGTCLLLLPISSAEGLRTSFVDALFTATTSVCVTGLVTVPTFSQWSPFGHSIITILIQVGGLGVVTFTTIVLLVLGKKITLKERILIQSAYNLNTLSGLVRLIIRIVKGVLFVEGVGAMFYAIVFIPRFGLIKGLGISVFNSVSFFCNAGMDIIGNDSMMEFGGNYIVNITSMLLIVLGGIGFPVWWNIIDVIRKRKTNYSGIKDALHHLTLHTKIVLLVTTILILFGALCVFIFEYTNINTIGNMSFSKKILASFFQSITTRTAGCFTVPQEELRNATAIICVGLMFIGGSPSGTAGGIKTTTIAIILLAVYTIVKGKRDTEVFNRKISTIVVKTAMAVVTLSFSVMMISVIALSAVQQVDFLDALYECSSAIATVGLSRALTPNLTTAGKLIIIVTMYIGRIGPISLALFFNTKKYVNVRSYQKEDIGVG